MLVTLWVFIGIESPDPAALKASADRARAIADVIDACGRRT